MGRYQWDWGVLFREPHLGWLASGLGWTITIAILAWLIAFSVGSAIGVMRTTPNRWLRLIGTIYVEIFRNIPLLLQMFIWFFVVPELLPREWGRWMKREMYYPEFTTAVICLGFYTASRVAEQVRSGIESVSKGLSRAALASGLTLAQTYRYILMPIAYRITIPSMTSEFLGVFKNSSLALTIGMLELTMQSRQIESFTFRGFEAFTAATIIYACVSWTLLLITRELEKRGRIKGMTQREGAT